MVFIQDKDKKGIQDRLKDLVSPVKLINFTQELECQFCRETRQLVTELAELSDKLELEVYNFQIDKEKADHYKVDKVPAIVIEGKKDYGVRYYGIPAGYEFASLLEAILAISQGESGLSEESKEKLRILDQELHIQVFVTPT
jgi:glutaredoxin-like protein